MRPTIGMAMWGVAAVALVLAAAQSVAQSILRNGRVTTIFDWLVVIGLAFLFVLGIIWSLDRTFSTRD